MNPRDLNPLARIRALGFPYTSAPTPPDVEPLPGPPLGDRYDSDWARTPLARATRVAAQETVGRAVTSVLCRPDVTNRDRIDELEGPAIFVANHHSHLDTGLVIASLPRPWRHEVIVAAAADYFFDTRTRAAVAAWFWGAIPMERKRVSRRSALAAAELIRDGWSLVIFPEGGRSPDGWGQVHKGGAAYLADRCGVPVVPIHIDGTDVVLPKGARTPKLHRVGVNFGAPIKPGDDDARRFAARIESALDLLAHESATDWYTAALSARHGASPSLRSPELDSWRNAWTLAQRLNRTEERSWRDRVRGSDPW